ncbi:site-specific integrase [Paraburkholderia sp. EG286B]|uniref:site-specific integrase n=1 Tax=Paraburkholderia sp. EG286B TaxID=3237011 RepID=UPI0034D38365
MTPLHQRMLHDMQIRNLAENTQKSYLIQVSSFARHFRRSPELLGPEEIRAWLIYLREERKLAPASLSPAIGALRFLYRVTLKRNWSDEDFPLPRKPVRLRVVLSLEEITTFFDSIPSLKPRWAGKFPHLWAPQNPPPRDARSMMLARSGRTLPFTPRMKKKRGCWSECLEAASANNHRHARRRRQTSARDCPDYGS